MAKGGTHIEWNSDMTGQYLTGPGIQSILYEYAEKVAATARAMAPVGETGAYRNSIQVQPTFSRMGRRGYEVLADVPYAAKLESQNGTLTKALNAHKIGR